MICCCCGGQDFTESTVLWKELIDEWRLGDHEVAYINRQQGLQCTQCNSSLRSLALAAAIMQCYGYSGLFQNFLKTKRAQALQILEINEAGTLSPFLAQIPGHVIKSYPEIDMMALPFSDNSFHLVVHSDTLEHVQHPIPALSECQRVLKPGGLCAFTIPIIVDRLTLSREGLPPSYHGEPNNKAADYLAYTEYGADAWKHVIQAGFAECRIFSLEYPAALALVGVKAKRGGRLNRRV
jgi:SAM-dependent methyltransferase